VIVNLSPLGAHFVVAREALVLVPYRDGWMRDPKDATKQVERWSIGAGSLAKHGGQTKPISVKKAFQQFRKAVRSREQEVRWALGIRVFSLPPVPVLQHHYDAVFSLYYQGGSDGLKAVAAHVQAGHMIEAANEFLRWDQDAAGINRTGLFARRQLERNLFLTGDYGKLNPVKLWRGDPRTTQPELYDVTAEDLKGWDEPDDSED
jgi:GH24 family phage-related lysozyme (muramidase)